METFVAFLFALAASVAGGLLVYLAHRGRLTAIAAELHREREINLSLTREVRLEAERRAAAEAKLEAEQRAQAGLKDAFQSMAAEALERSTGQFLSLATESFESRQASLDELVKPLRDSLTAVDSKIHQLEVSRASAYSSLTEQVKSLAGTQSLLQNETANLVKALRAPATRGRWGELQLKRAVEMAGMVEYCDFCEQQTVHTEAGRIRPDLVVQMPNGRRVVVDAKTPLSAYLDALECSDDELRVSKLRLHATQVRGHVSKLAAKSYWAQFDRAPEFVVVFLPGESFFSAALQHDPDLIQFGIDQKVLLATPTTLIALLKSVAYGWREERIAQNAAEISRLGNELYDRLANLASHFGRVGDHLEKATKSYNDAVGALERRVLPAARKMKERGATASPDIDVLEPLEATPRQIVAAELQPGVPLTQ